MVQTVFWSWQSDQPSRETRNIIRDALVSALDRIAIEMEEAERPEIDHDTKDAPGSPDIVATILAKIQQAAVFVADVTPIAVSDGGKQVANPNVLIELGYAKRALGTERVITVWNTALTNARPEDLPFDMRHRRGPVAFALPPGSTTDELRKVRTDLTKQLEQRIRASLGAVPAVPAEPLRWQKSQPELPGLWDRGGEPLMVNLGLDGSTGIQPAGAPFGFARLLPTSWSLSPSAAKVLDSATGHPLPLGRCSGIDYGPTTGGFIAFRSSETVREQGVTPTATRWFRETGELWGIATSYFAGGNDAMVLATKYAIERWVAWIEGNVRVATMLGGKGPWHVKLGLEGLAGTAWPNRFGRGEGTTVALEDRVEWGFVLDEVTTATVTDAVRDTFNKVLEAYGLDPMDANEFGHFSRS
ncbi:hypothetical protein [Novosphingobium sp.]|jgi:hypothetical protein|uniref:hypothetical protein n=1 Tax=Novosphingobium sp. TaxID=1874826 RepID=UPI001D5A32CD|nr:hypothetical protein [Novosphingobium sp.]MBK6718935.1 hypothetical protein [Sphingomonadales bacterium]MBK8860922.1 hypothetical protein [Sphingomonadales bacterium]MBL0000497.1 hypothetical protein [Sphingomonadales bacterium]MBL0114659.1 hypothetical protein [Sphingomonadales bacterium]MCC6925488.1 hypothetical protein [Novosphingobium sp.]